jgi:hypothetical protein
MEKVCFSEMLLSTYESTQSHNSDIFLLTLCYGSLLSKVAGYKLGHFFSFFQTRLGSIWSIAGLNKIDHSTLLWES